MAEQCANLPSLRPLSAPRKISPARRALPGGTKQGGEKERSGSSAGHVLTLKMWLCEELKYPRREVKTTTKLQQFLLMRKKICKYGSTNACNRDRQRLEILQKMSQQQGCVFPKLFYRPLKMLLHEITSGSFTNPSAWEIYATRIHLFPANCTFISSSCLCKAMQAEAWSGASQAVPHALLSVCRALMAVPSPAGGCSCSLHLGKKDLGPIV